GILDACRDEVVAIESRAMDEDPIECIAKPAECRVVLVDDGHAMPGPREGGSELGADTAASDDDDIHNPEVSRRPGCGRNVHRARNALRNMLNGVLHVAHVVE